MLVASLDEVHGFRYFDSRDLLGFVDGTENRTGQEAVDATVIGEEDFAFRRRQLCHRAEISLTTSPGWNSLPTEAQEYIIGRTELSDIEIDELIRPTSAHNSLNTIVEDGKEIKIVRDNMPFGVAGRGRVWHLLHRLQPFAAHHGANAKKTCSSAVRRAITIAFSTSAGLSPATCSSCRPRRFSTRNYFLRAVGYGARRSSPAVDPSQPIPPMPDGSLGVGSLKGKPRS